MHLLIQSQSGSPMLHSNQMNTPPAPSAYSIYIAVNPVPAVSVLSFIAALTHLSAVLFQSNFIGFILRHLDSIIPLLNQCNSAAIQHKTEDSFDHACTG